MRKKLSLALASTILCGAAAQSPVPSGGPGLAPEDVVQDYGWPRQFETAEYEIVLHQPQVDEWPGFERIQYRAALAIARKGTEERGYGMIRANATTQVSVSDRLVLLADRNIEQVSFPNVEAARAGPWRAAVLEALRPSSAMTISLDRVISQLDASQVQFRPVDVNLEPPKILASEVPAVLVILLGQPRFDPIPGGGSGDLHFAVNTNWDLFLDPATKQYYLLDGRSWLVTSDLEKGPWTPAKSLPVAFRTLPADANWNEVRAAIPLLPARSAPVVHVSNEPAELIVTKGPPEYEAVPETRLSRVSNTESAVFFNTAEGQHYFLAAGRWFKASGLAGPWTAASTSLPEDFRRIPEDANTEHVLAAVPGTRAANEARILASIPEKATVSRADLTVTPTYDGEPRWRSIESTGVQYAYNSPYDVFLVDGNYYCCHDAVWFAAPTPTGAWTVADAVPAAIYSIPPTSPMHDVTYVYVFGSTADSVVTGYTSGYLGGFLAPTGVLMFGQGILPGWNYAGVGGAWDYHYSACAFSYGCGAHYLGALGGYFPGGTVYGPRGGFGGYAPYNAIGCLNPLAAYAYVPSGAAVFSQTSAIGQFGRRGRGPDIFGDWGPGVVPYGAGWVGPGWNTAGGLAIVPNWYGNGATVVMGSEMYAGQDGNIYTMTPNGWQPPTTMIGYVPPGAAASPYRAPRQQA
ncbi:MAG: hypothetical protein ACKVXR_08650, partial [Planctomycetota bacterium]